MTMYWLTVREKSTGAIRTLTFEFMALRELAEIVLVPAIADLVSKGVR